MTLNEIRQKIYRAMNESLILSMHHTYVIQINDFQTLVVLCCKLVESKYTL
jgi:hypothetical protein